jgi:hypothetical protein
MQMMERYMGPLTIFLNSTKTPYIELGEDPRYFGIASRDLFHRANYVLATKSTDEGVKVSHVEGYHQLSKNIIKNTMPVKNGWFSKMFMMAEPDCRLSKPGKRTNLLSVYSNGSVNSGALQKFPYIKEYVLDNFVDSTIYGVWDSSTEGIEPYLNRIHPTPMIELQEQMYNTKYAFMIPIKKGGWTTSKFYKHLIFGIIPFFHEISYSPEYGNIPEFLILKSAKDFKEKIDFLENNPDEYLKLWKECQSLLKNEYFTGHFYNDVMLNVLEEFYPKEIEIIKTNVKNKSYNMSCLFKNPSVDKKTPEKTTNFIKLF